MNNTNTNTYKFKDCELWFNFYNNFEYYLNMLPVHKNILIDIENYLDICSSPNLLFYGPKGFPNLLLFELALCNKMKTKFPLSKKYPVWNNILNYIETNYYVEIDMENPDFPQDIQILNKFLLNIINNKCIYLDRHIIILKNIDLYENNSAQIFRVLLERFSKNVLFIVTTNTINSIEEPLRSRMLNIRIPLPSIDDNKTILSCLTKKYRIADRNLLKNIFLNETAILKKYKEIPTLNFPPIKEIIDNNLTSIDIRKLSLKMFQQDIHIRDIIMDLFNNLKNEKDKLDFLEKSAEIEHKSKLLEKSKIGFCIELILNLYINYK